jgi:hypothetical protein
VVHFEGVEASGVSYTKRALSGSHFLLQKRVTARRVSQEMRALSWLFLNESPQLALLSRYLFKKYNAAMALSTRRDAEDHPQGKSLNGQW